MIRILESVRDDESGATSIEYAMIGSMISIVIVASCLEIGNIVDGMFSRVVVGFAP